MVKKNLVHVQPGGVETLIGLISKGEKLMQRKE
jgi:hypothetical protein